MPRRLFTPEQQLIYEQQFGEILEAQHFRSYEITLEIGNGSIGLLMDAINNNVVQFVHDTHTILTDIQQTRIVNKCSDNILDFACSNMPIEYYKPIYLKDI